MTAAAAGSLGEIGDASVMDADAVAAALHVDVENGLSAQEAARRLAQNGANELRAAPRAPAWRPVLAHFQDPLIYLLLAAVAVALVAWCVEGTDAQGGAGRWTRSSSRPSCCSMP
jgi:P-type Ca2+ transporter type 2C